MSEYVSWRRLLEEFEELKKGGGERGDELCWDNS
jgi:hypothetical protein